MLFEQKKVKKNGKGKETYYHASASELFVLRDKKLVG